MTKTRIKETDQGIQDESTVRDYDRMARRLSEKGWTSLKDILASGIRMGHALEVGPGPGYLGLDWLKATGQTRLTGLDISQNMIRRARQNAREYRLSDRATYVLHNADRMPFGDNTFDAVFTNGSLHEWEQPVQILREIRRVLKPGGRFFISDLRRDMNALVKLFMRSVTRPRSIRPGLISSINASYTCAEARDILNRAGIPGARVTGTPMGIILTGLKNPSPTREITGQPPLLI